MMELPETIVITQQANETLKGKKIMHVFNATKAHRFTFYHGDPQEYGQQLIGKTIQSAVGYGMFLDLQLTNGAILSLGEGTLLKYGACGDKIPANYQLLLGFEDDSFLVLTVSLYGFIGVYTDGIIDEKYHKSNKERISPLDDNYTEGCFYHLIAESKKNLTAKALLATEQRIPGVGNGVLQDILFNARINPKRKVSTLSDTEKTNLFQSLKMTLKEMVLKGGRDTQSDLYGNNGGYRTILTSKTWKIPCPVCGNHIVKESYMGGAVYYCPNCQV